MKPMTLKNRQGGAVLIVSIMLLLAATMATLASVRGNPMHERMAANHEYKGMSFLSAESGATRFLAWLANEQETRGWPTEDRQDDWQEQGLNTCPQQYSRLKGIESCIMVDAADGVHWEGSQVAVRIVGRVVSPAGILSESVIDLQVEGAGSPIEQPQAQAAFTCYGEHCLFGFKGAPVKISGYDHPVSDGEFNCNGAGCNYSADTWNDAVPGISMPNRPSGGAADKPKQVEGDPPVQRGGSGAQDQAAAWQAYANALLGTGAAHEVSSGQGLPASSREHPAVSNIVGNVTLNGSADSAGVIIVGPGASLSFKGTFHHEGLVIVLPGGTFDVSGGTAWLYGGVVDLSGNAPGHYVDLRGNVHIRYSAEALGNLNRIKNASRLVLKGWNESL